jgi:UDP-glucose/iron transport system ATP-binding protein
VSKTPPLLQINQLQRLMIGPVSLYVEEGDCLCISGPSGSGKSLLLRAIADLDAHAGEACLRGVAASSIPAESWRRRVGLLPPESVWWLPRVGDHFRGELPVALEHIGLTAAVMAQPVAQLSSGEKQRLALMRLLSNHPEVLLLDEPTANLDPENTRRIETVIAEYRRTQQAVIIWVSHDQAQIARVADRHYAVSNGTLEERTIEGRQWLN